MGLRGLEGLEGLFRVLGLIRKEIVFIGDDGIYSSQSFTKIPPSSNLNQILLNIKSSHKLHH